MLVHYLHALVDNGVLNIHFCKTFVQHFGTLTTAIVLVLSSFHSLDICCSLFNDVSLLSDTHTLHLLKADSHSIIEVLCLKSRCSQMNLGCLVVPKYFVWLIDGC